MSKILDLTVQLSCVMQGGVPTDKINKAAKAIENLTSKARSIQANNESINSFQKLSSQIERNSAVFEQNQLRIKAAASQLDAYQARQQALIKLMNAAKNSGDKSKEAAYKKELESIKKQTQELQKYQEKIQSQNDKLHQQYWQNAQTLSQMGSSLREAGINTDTLANAQDKLQRELQETQAASTRIAELRTKLAGLQEALSWNNIRGDIIKSMGMIRMLEQPVKISMDFNAAMSSLQSVARFSEEQFAEMQRQAMELGAKTQFTATDAAKTMEVLTRSGMTPVQVSAAIEPVMNMAAAEGLGLADAADKLSRILGGMNLDADQAQRLTDVLAFTSKSANTNISKIAEVMKIAAPIAGSAGISLEQLSAMIGGMATHGYAESDAGTALASTITRLAKITQAPNSDAAKALKQLGVAIMTRDGKMRQMPDILKAIYKKTSKMGDLQREGYMTRIFGQNHVKAITALMDSVMKGEVADLEARFANNEHAGWAADTARIRNDNLTGDITRLSSAWEGFMIRIGKPLENMTRPLVQGLTKALDLINDFADRNEGIFNTVVEIAGVFAGMKIAKTVLDFGVKIFSWVKTARDLASATRDVADVTGALGRAAGLASISTGALAWQLMAIAGALYLIYVNWDKIKDFFGSMGNVITTDPAFRATDPTQYAPDTPEYHIANMDSAFAIPSLAPQKKPGKQHALGGLFNIPHIAQVAEDGPEAIIPLTDKIRGTSLLMQAASKLGIPLNNNNSGSESNGSLNLDLPSMGTNNNSFVSSPVVNITVNASEGESRDNESLADLISRKVSEVLESISSNAARLSYA